MDPSAVGGWTTRSGAILLVLVFASILTWPVCLVIFDRYRRAVARGMRRTSSTAPPPPPPLRQRQLPAPAPTGPVREIELVAAPAPSSAPLVQRVHRSIRRVQLVFGAAAVGYGATAVAVSSYVDDLAWLPLRTVILCLIFSWPIVPTLVALSPTGPRDRWLIWAAWLLVIIVLLAIGRLPLAQMLLLLVLVVALPLLFLVASSARSVRGAAWLVGPVLVIVGFALWELVPVGLALVLGVRDGAFIGPFLARAVGGLLVLPLYAWAITRIYTGKLVSDETLLILQWWLVATLAFAAFFAPVGLVPAALGLVPYAILLALVAIGFLVLRPPPQPAVRLLLLRTFGARRRSTRLLREMTRQWRWVGSVELITAPDLATEALTPDGLLDFLSFRLPRRFVRDVSAIGSRRSELDLRPDRDGRYRVNELMCHDDTWRPTVEALMSSVDVILIDLRGFGAHNAGVMQELERLVALVPLHRVVAMTDASTDVLALRSALWQAAAAAPPSSPLALDPRPTLRVTSSPDTRAGARALLATLGAAAERGPRPDGVV